MKVELITPDKKVFQGDATAVKVPGSGGTFEVLENHAAIISTLSEGQIRIRSGKDDKFFQIDGGLIEVLKNNVVILAESVK